LTVLRGLALWPARLIVLLGHLLVSFQSILKKYPRIVRANCFVKNNFPGPSFRETTLNNYSIGQLLTSGSSVLNNY
jgi:hypothetical protein